LLSVIIAAQKLRWPPKYYNALHDRYIAVIECTGSERPHLVDSSHSIHIGVEWWVLGGSGGRYPDFRHPGLDPGSIAAPSLWTPDQVRGDDEGDVSFWLFAADAFVTALNGRYGVGSGRCADRVAPPQYSYE
jgi:hypothetical protein